MSSNSKVLRITQALLSSYNYINVTEDGFENFLATLNRTKTPPTKAMLDGIQFEGLVNACLDGVGPPEGHELTGCVHQVVDIIQPGAQQQVTIFKEYEVDGQVYLLHGVLDFLHKGVIYDTKFSKSYEVNKYYKSPQHPMYFELVPEANRFEYVICDGHYVYTENYWRSETPAIAYKIRSFAQWLKTVNLWSIYKDKWEAN